MNIKGMRGMLAAAAVVVTTVISLTSVGAQAAGSQQKYADDAIVRDLKAGKLTVHEAQILQDRREHGAAKPVAKTGEPAAAPTSSAKPAHAAKSVKSGKGGKAQKSKGKAPVTHLTSAHHAPAKHGAKKAAPHHAAAHAVKPVHPAKKKDKTATKKPEPVRKTAVKYIR